MVQYWVQPRRSCWIQEALTRYPSTARSGKLSLLCETSLTHCPPRQEPLDPSLRPSPLVHLFAWNGQVNNKSPTESDPLGWANVPSLLCPHLGYKLALQSSAICCLLLLHINVYEIFGVINVGLDVLVSLSSNVLSSSWRFRNSSPAICHLSSRPTQEMLTLIEEMNLSSKCSEYLSQYN